MVFLIVQSLYWLALATWFGGVLFVALSAPIIHRAIKESNPILPHVLSVNLESQHGSLLAGTIVAKLLLALGRIQVVCAAVLFLALLSQWRLTATYEIWLLSLIVRCTLYVAAVMLMIYDNRYLLPRLWLYRQEYIDHADEPDIANPAKEQFDRYHRESITLLSVVLCLLLGMILFSSLIKVV